MGQGGTASQAALGTSRTWGSGRAGKAANGPTSGDGLGVDGGDFEQGAGGAFRPSSPLLPVL